LKLILFFFLPPLFISLFIIKTFHQNEFWSLLYTWKLLRRFWKRIGFSCLREVFSSQIFVKFLTLFIYFGFEKLVRVLEQVDLLCDKWGSSFWLLSGRRKSLLLCACYIIRSKACYLIVGHFTLSLSQWSARRGSSEIIIKVLSSFLMIFDFLGVLILPSICYENHYFLMHLFKVISAFELVILLLLLRKRWLIVFIYQGEWRRSKHPIWLPYVIGGKN
jgi:hypothetical protein